MDAEVRTYQDDFERDPSETTSVAPSRRRARAVTIAAALAHVALLSGCTSGNPQENIGTLGSALSGPVLTHHNDNARTGAILNETSLNPTNVSPHQFGYLYNLPVLGSIYAQPLVASNVTINGQTYASVLYVATMANMVYAFDVSGTAPTHALLIAGPAGSSAGAATLEPPTPNNDAPVDTCVSCLPQDMVIGGCANAGGQVNIPGEIGILSTPVIVGNTMYLITTTGSHAENQQFLHALNITTFQEVHTKQVVTQPPGVTQNGGEVFTSSMEVQRPALLASNGTIYAAFGAYCDVMPYNGYVIGFDAADLSPKFMWNDTPYPGGAGGIWQSGEGPAADQAGNVYLLTGNGDCANCSVGGGGMSIVQPGGTNVSEAMVRLTPELGFGASDTTAWFIPDNYQQLEAYDVDFGSAGILLLPNTNLVLGGGKYSTIYVADKTNLGGFDSQEIVQSLAVNLPPDTSCGTTCAKGYGLRQHLPEIHGLPVYWSGSNSDRILPAPRIYVWATSDVLKSYTFDSSTLQFATTPTESSAMCVGNPGAMLSISANGTTNGIVWASRAFSNGPANGAQVFAPRQGRLMAFDAGDVSNLLWDSASEASAPAAPTFSFSKNAPPTIANGKVFLASFPNVQTPEAGNDSAAVMVYGLMALPPSTFSVTEGFPQTVLLTGGSLAASQQFGLAGNTDVFAVDNNGQLNVAWVSTNGPWSGPAEPTSNNAFPNPSIQFPPGAPVAASNQFGLPNNTDLFAVDVNGNLDVAWVNAGNPWQGPSPIGAQCSNGQGGYYTDDNLPCQFPNDANIAVSQQFPLDQTDVFIVDTKGALTVSWVTGRGNWQSAEITANICFQSERRSPRRNSSGSIKRMSFSWTTRVRSMSSITTRRRRARRSARGSGRLRSETEASSLCVPTSPRHSSLDSRTIRMCSRLTRRGPSTSRGSTATTHPADRCSWCRLVSNRRRRACSRTAPPSQPRSSSAPTRVARRTFSSSIRRVSSE